MRRHIASPEPGDTGLHPAACAGAARTAAARRGHWLHVAATAAMAWSADATSCHDRAAVLYDAAMASKKVDLYWKPG
jgi:hypothetical protein